MVGKKIRGRKGHILVDTLGNLLGVLVLSAGLSDATGAALLLTDLFARLPQLVQTLAKLWADQAYRGELVDYFREAFGIDLEIVERPPDQTGFVLLPRWWVVERTLAWLCRSRHLSKDYEHLPESSETVVYIASIHLLLKRLYPAKTSRLPYQDPRCAA